MWLDEWNQFLHGADNNGVSLDDVGPPQRLRWHDTPEFGLSKALSPSFTNMVSADGVLLTIEDRATTEDINADLDSIGLAAAKRKFVVIKGWPDFTWLDRNMMKRPHAELLEMARERITFPLACFLVGAHSDSHFYYSWGYTDRHGMLESYPELDRPLGPPQSAALWHGLTATRKFEHASVWVDLNKKEARIDWNLK